RFLKEYEESIANIQKNDFTDEFGEDYLMIKEFILSNEYPNILKKGNKFLDKVQVLLIDEDTKSLLSLIHDVLGYKKELREFYSNYSAFRDKEEIPSFHWEAEEQEKDEALKRKIKK